VDVQSLVEGWVRVWEVTHGVNGWHPHVHAVVVLSEGSGSAELERVASGMFKRWSRGLVGAGLDAPLLVAQDWHVVNGERASDELGGYLSKFVELGESEAAGLGLELTHSMPGRARAALKTRPVWSLLDDLAETGEAENLERWHEWERASKGKRQVGWSKGLRDRFAPEVAELSDDEIVDEELGTADDDVVHWSAPQWRELVRVPARLVELLEAVESGGRGAVVQLLDVWGVSYSIEGVEPWKQAKENQA
jgi:hypothetical protein